MGCLAIPRKWLTPKTDEQIGDNIMLSFTINQQFALKEVAIQIIGQEQQLQTNNQWYGLKANADGQKLWFDENSFVLLGTASGAQLVKWLFMRGFKNLDQIFQAYIANKQAKLEARLARRERIAAWWTAQQTPDQLDAPAPEFTPEQLVAPASETATGPLDAPAPNQTPELVAPAPDETPEEVAAPAPEVTPEEEEVAPAPDETLELVTSASKSTPKGKKGQRKTKKG